jgi:hypothetical protein
VEVSEVLNALERERELLREFCVLSTQELTLLDDEHLDDDIRKLLDVRSDLMLELNAIETTLETWITQLRNDWKITPEVLTELRIVNDEIVRIANEIIEVDDQTHRLLDLIKHKAADESHGT